MIGYATKEIALRTSEVVGGLLNASFGNAVELIVSIIAPAKGSGLDRPNFADWQHALQSSVGDGHVLFLRRR